MPEIRYTGLLEMGTQAQEGLKTSLHSESNTVVLNLPNTGTLFSTVPDVVMSPKHRIILLLLHNSNFAFVVNCNMQNI